MRFVLPTLLLIACGPATSTVPSRAASEYTVPEIVSQQVSNEVWDEVIARLRAENPTFIPIEVEWEYRDGVRRVEVGFIDGRVFRERYVDTDTFETVESLVNDFSTPQDEADFPAVHAALMVDRVRLEEGLTRARERFGSDLRQVEFVIFEGDLAVQVDVDRGEGERTFHFDPRTGASVDP